MPPSAAVLRKGKREKTIGDFFFFSHELVYSSLHSLFFVFLSCVSLFFLLSSSLLFSTYFHMTCCYFVFFFLVSSLRIACLSYSSNNLLFLFLSLSLYKYIYLFFFCLCLSVVGLSRDFIHIPFFWLFHFLPFPFCFSFFSNLLLSVTTQ